MNIETTININPGVHRLILNAIDSTGQSKNMIISSLMRRVADDHDKMVATWSRIRYQKRDPDAVWLPLHLALRPDEYEFFQDLRKVFKCSISFLVAYAVKKYLKEIIHKLAINPDNYRYKNYMFQRVIVDNVICWILSWGVPRTIIANHY